MVMIVSALEALLRVAVTVVVAAFSEIELSDSASLTVGAPSSSSMVSVWLDGLATPLPPLAIAEMVTDLFGESAWSLLAAMVTVPELVVAPAAMVNVVPVCLKSEVAVLVPAAEATVSVTA